MKAIHYKTGKKCVDAVFEGKNMDLRVCVK